MGCNPLNWPLILSRGPSSKYDSATPKLHARSKGSPSKFSSNIVALLKFDGLNPPKIGSHFALGIQVYGMETIKISKQMWK